MSEFTIEDIPKVAPDLATPITGIPQSAANPLLDTFGAPEWEQDDKEHQDALNQWYRSGTDSLDAAALDPETAFKGMDLGFSADRQAAQRSVVNDSWLELNQEEPVAPDELQRRIQIQATSLARFGEMVDSDEALFPLIQKDAQRRKDGKALARELTVAAFDDAMLPSDKAPGFTAFREKLKAHAGYRPENGADYVEAWHETRRAAKEKVDEFREPLVQVWRAFKTDGNVTAAAYDAYSKLTPEQRPQFMDALAIRARALPDAERATFWANMGKVTGQAVSDYGRNAAESAQANSFNVAGGAPGLVTMPGSLEDDAATRELRKALKSDKQDFQQARNFAADVRKVAREDYDPLKSAFGDGDGKPGFWEGVAYQATGVTVTSLSMAIPYVGVATMALSMEGQAYEGLRGRMLAGGMDDATATAYAEGIAPFVALPQAALEKVGFGIWSRKLPGFSKVMDTLGDKIANRVLRGGAKTLTIGTAETGIELLQDATNYAVQDIAAALSDDVPEVDWSKELSGTWAQAPEIFATMLPLAILGAAGGLNAESQQAAFARSTTTELEAFGINPEGIAAIQGAQGPASLASAIESAMETRDPNTEAAAAAVAELKQKAASQRQAVEDLERLGYAAPTFTTTPEGVFVFDSEGNELGMAQNYAGASRIAAAHTTALVNMEQDRVDALTSLMEGVKAAVGLDPTSETEVNLGEFDPAQATPGMAARFAAQVALKEVAEGGTGNIARSVLGYSVTEMAQGVRHTVNRLFKGASITDAFHETGHGLRRKAHAAGTVTRAMEASLLINQDTVYAGRRVRDAQGKQQGTDLRLVPDGITAAMLETGEIPAAMIPAEFDGDGRRYADQILDEGVSEIIEAEVLKLRKGKGRGKLGITRELVQKNLQAMARLNATDAKSWKSFFAAVRGHWGLAMSRAVAMAGAERRGEFDPAERDAYLDKLLGLDQQTEHDAGVQDEFSRMLAGFDDVEMEEDDIPFSIGSFSIGGARANLPAFQRDSRETAVAMAAAGKSGEEIRALTGWFPGKYDGKLRFEIPDQGAKWKSLDGFERKESASGFYVQGKLGSLFEHPALFDAYPDIADLDVLLFRGRNPSEKGLDGARGAFRKLGSESWIEIYNAIHTPVYAEKKVTQGPFAISEEERVKINEEEEKNGTFATELATSSLLHEIQHWIQEKENFAKGGSPKSEANINQRLVDLIENSTPERRAAYDRWSSIDMNVELGRDWDEDAYEAAETALAAMPQGEEMMRVHALLSGNSAGKVNATSLDVYRRTAGEIEARDVQARQNYTDEQRAAIAPYSSENIAPEDAVYFSSGTASMDEGAFSIGRATQLAKKTEKSAKIAEEDFFTTFWPRMMKLAGQNLKASTRNINEAARRAVVDIGEWVKNNPKFQDYYNEDWKNTRGILNETFPEFTDDLFRGFRLFTGLTSPSTPLDGNLADAVQLMNLWIGKGSLLSMTLKKSDKGNRAAGPGPFPLRSNTGATKIFSLHVVEGLFRKFGNWEKTVEFLNEPVSVKDLHAFNKEMGYAGSVGGIGNIRRVVMEATGQDTMIPRMFIFGQKVGAYTLNTLGDHRYTTTDIWESRFIRSYFPEMFKTSDGLPVNEDEHTIFQRFASAFNAQFEAQYGVKLENSALQAVRWFYMLAHAKEAGYRYARTNQTISGYTLQAVRTYLGNDSENRGRGSEGRGGAEPGEEVGAFSIGGVSANLPKMQVSRLETARAMQENGKSFEEIRSVTGWSPNPYDGKLRFEIPDEGTTFKPTWKTLENHGTAGFTASSLAYKSNDDGTFDITVVPDDAKTTKEIIHFYKVDPSVLREYLPGAVVTAIVQNKGEEGVDFIGDFEPAMRVPGPFYFEPLRAMPLGDLFDHPKLFAAYPSAKFIRVNTRAGSGGHFSPTDNSIEIGLLGGKDQQRSVLLHEIQHWIQEKENFAKGANLETVKTMARKEARKVYDTGKVQAARDAMREASIHDKAATILGWRAKPESLTRSESWFAVKPMAVPKMGSKARADFMEEMRILAEADLLRNSSDFDQRRIYELTLQPKEELQRIARNAWNRYYRAAPAIREHERLVDLSKMDDTEKRLQYYRHFAGEIESREVQARRDMTREQRAGTPFYSAENIPADKAIVSMDYGTLKGGKLPLLSTEDPASFSIGPAQVAGILSDNALSRITDPRRRTYVMSRIARDFNAMRLQIERITSLSGIRRSKGDLRREAMAREDLAAEEKIAAIHKRFGSLLADEDLVKIKSQLVHAYLSDPTTPLRGKLMSKKQAIKNHPDQYQLHREGHYDGSDNVSRSVFGGTWHPADAAQNLFDEGLISEPTADAMWEALLTEQKTVAGMKEMLAKAQEEIRAAKAEAKQEANEWLATQGKDQEVNFSDKEEIRRSLRMLDAILLALPAEIRGKIGGYTQISMIASDDARLAYLKDKLAKADKELEDFLRVEYAKEWEELLKKAAPQTNEAGQRPTGSIAADAYDVFRVAEHAMGLGFAEGEAEADKWDAIADHPDTDPKDVDLARVKAQMIRLTMNWPAADAARREQAVLEGDKIYFGGLRALAIENSRRRERLGKLRDSAVRGTGKTGHRMEREAAKQATATKLGAVKAMAWEFLSFGQVVNVLFGEKSDAARWMNSREIAASNGAHDGFQSKANALESLFDTLSGNRFDGEKLRHRMATDPRITVKDVLGVDHTFTESQAITFLLMYRQEDGKRHLQGLMDDAGNVVSEWAWDDKSAATIEAGLSSEGRAAMAFLGSSYGEEYGRINDVFRRIWNVSMPRHKMYAPLSVKPVQGKGDTIMDPVSGDTMGAGMTPGSLKNRSFSAIAEPDFKDAFQVYLTHARQMEHFIAYAEFSRDALGIINRRETRNAIEAAGGADAAATLSKWVDYFALGGVHGAAMGGAWTKILGGMLGRLSQAALVGRVSVLCMQSLQLAAASFKMPTGAFLTRFAKLSAGRLQWGDTIRSEYIQRRLQQLPPVVRDMMQGMASGTPNRAKYLAGQMGRSIAGADALFTAGTYAIFYDYHLGLAKKAGIANPEAHAHAEAERFTDQVAQPVRTGARSWLEVANAGNPAFRAAWNYSSDPRQKMSLLVYAAMRRDTTGAEKAGDVAFTAAKLWIVGGVLQTLMRTVLRDLRNDDDDEIFDERYWSPARLALQVGTGPLGAVPFLGGMMEDATYKLTGQFAPQGGMLAFLDQAAGLPKKWAGGKVEPIKDAETLATAGAGFSGTSAAAASAMHIIRDVVGFIENLEGPD